MSLPLRRFGPALVAVAGAAVIALLVARRQPYSALVGPSGGRLAFELAATLAVAIAGVVVGLRGPDRRAGGLLVAVAAVWLVAEWNSPGALGAIVFTGGLLAGELAPAVVAHTALVYGRDGRPSALDRVVMAAAYATSGLMLGLAFALVCLVFRLFGFSSLDLTRVVGVAAGLVTQTALGGEPSAAPNPADATR